MKIWYDKLLNMVEEGFEHVFLLNEIANIENGGLIGKNIILFIDIAYSFIYIRRFTCLMNEPEFEKFSFMLKQVEKKAGNVKNLVDYTNGAKLLIEFEQGQFKVIKNNLIGGNINKKVFFEKIENIVEKFENFKNTIAIVNEYIDIPRERCSVLFDKMLSGNTEDTYGEFANNLHEYIGYAFF